MSNIKLFENKRIRSTWNKPEQKLYFAIVDIVSVLTESVDSHAYWRKLKERLKKEGNETVTNCHGLKEEIENPGLAQKRMREIYKAKGYSDSCLPAVRQGLKNASVGLQYAMN
jgi:hypothetical protein